MEEKEVVHKKNLAIKILIPVAIIVVVLGIWFIKNGQKQKINSPVTNADFALAAVNIDMEHLKTYGLPIMIDFGADSCIPCKEMAPILKETNKEYQGKVIVKFVDVWKYKEAAANFPIQVIPTQFFFDKNGKPFVPSDAKTMQMDLYSDKETKKHVYTAHQGGMTKQQILAVFKELGVE